MMQGFPPDHSWNNFQQRSVKKGEVVLPIIKEEDIFKQIDETIIFDNIMYRACKILEEMKGHGFSVSQEKFNNLEVPSYKPGDFSKKIIEKLEFLNRIEVLIGERVSLPKHLLELGGDYSNYLNKTIIIEKIGEDDESQFIVKMIERGSSNEKERK